MNENLSKIYSFFPEKDRERKKRGRKYKEVIRRISRHVPSEIFFTFNGHQRQTPPFRFSRLGFGLETTRPWNRRDSPVSMERHKVTEIVNFEKPIFRTVPHSRDCSISLARRNATTYLEILRNSFPLFINRSSKYARILIKYRCVYMMRFRKK